ncbi:peptidyl-prolyl cis-trans isomerase [Myxozyma melibiosi]|uniref:peptidylprolyl isomerase n=1 Tax=Myxozyma melibiosi TaxID=54550 RepID=A0ABR1EYF0_9ASCO
MAAKDVVDEEKTKTRKRSAEDVVDRSDADESSSDDDFGPKLPSAAGPSTTADRRKKRRVLKHESAYLRALPSFERYTRSYMHRKPLALTRVSASTNFVLTLSIDGVLKFWKKKASGIEFVKQFQAHAAPPSSSAAAEESVVVGGEVSADGKMFASIGTDRTIKIFDVVNFDMINIFKELPYTPGCVGWLQKKGQVDGRIAVSDKNSSRIFIYDVRSDSQDPLHVLPELHKTPVRVLSFNPHANCVISIDEGGMVEYWRPEGTFDQPDDDDGGVISFKFKSTTDLYEFRKFKCLPTSLTFSADGSRFATFSLPDRMVRVFDFKTGKLHRKYDESLDVAIDMQRQQQQQQEEKEQKPTQTHALRKLDDIEFGKRIAIERELEQSGELARDMNVVFDDSGHFILYATYLGIKVINMVTNRCVRLLGSEDNIRFLNLSVYQGAPDRKDVMTLEMAASDNALVSASLALDPTVFATAVGKVRFYMFTNYEGEFAAIKNDRDVLNERPLTKLDGKSTSSAKSTALSAKGVTLHTSLGDIQIRLYAEHAPLAVENFVTLCKKGYYDSTIFHRVIKKFMIQGGDPLGDGTGGESMWGKEFKDEFTKALRHDRPFVVSMANAGPNTNGSQFFITTEKAPWLDDKHTIFGRVVLGMDVVKRIEGLKTDKNDKPEDPPSILSITVL